MSDIDRVTSLFTQQGFTIDQEDDSSFLARGDDTVLGILIITSDDNPDKATDRIDEYSDHPDADRTIVFIPEQLDEALQEQLEEAAERNGFETSYISSDKEQEIETPDTMPSSYEIIGDIALLNLDDDQLADKDAIADAVQQQNPNVDTVLRKTEALDGEFRVGEYETIRGDTTETTHVEHGCRYRVDPTKVYFSERLGHERERVLGQVSDGETIQVWFAGVGPYAILFAREAAPEHVHAIEKNPAGCDYLEENIELNDVEDLVTAHCGDVREIVPDLDSADRIVMPLPGSADEFLDLALQHIDEGGVIHYYRFCSEEEQWDKPLDEIADAADRQDRSYTIDAKVVCGHYAPYIDRVCIDIRVT